MAKKKKDDLGLGIRALLGNMDNNDSEYNLENSKFNGILEIPLTEIEINPFQPRIDFDQDALKELSTSISVHGVVQPITVRRLNKNKYQLIAGERRLRASKMAGLIEIPAFVREADDQEMLEIALIENIQRENLNAVEVAITYKRLMDECDLTQDKMSERLGKSRSTVTNFLRLLKLPPDIQLGIKERKISMGHAKALMSLEHVEDQLFWFKNIISKSLSVRNTEDAIRSLKQEKSADKKKTKASTLPKGYLNVQNDLTSQLGTKVELKRNPKGKGQIVINFFSDDDFNRILELLDK